MQDEATQREVLHYEGGTLQKAMIRRWLRRRCRACAAGCLPVHRAVAMRVADPPKDTQLSRPRSANIIAFLRLWRAYVIPRL